MQSERTLAEVRLTVKENEKKNTPNTHTHNGLRANLLSHLILSIINANASGCSFISLILRTHNTVYEFKFIKYSMYRMNIKHWIDRWINERKYRTK